MEFNISFGKPENRKHRLQKELKTYSLLDSLNIEYTVIDHEKADDMESCEAIGRSLGVEICKNLFLCNRQKTVFYLLIMPSKKPFKTKELSAQLGISRLSFAEEEFMLKFLDITPGSVSIMGLMNDAENHVNLIIDQDLLKNEFFGCHPCINTSSIKIRTEDILNRFLPEINHKYTLVSLGGSANE